MRRSREKVKVENLWLPGNPAASASLAPPVKRESRSSDDTPPPKMSTIKTEPGIKLEPGAASSAPNIKSEPGISPAAIKADPDLYEDDELYEDPGDLDISNGGGSVWLVKLPSFVAERWNEIDEDEEITLGYVKVKSQTDDSPQSDLKLTLERNAINGDEIPLEYDLKITNMELQNTYVFTEKDLPGYENKQNTGVKEGSIPMPARFLQQQKESTPGADRTDGANKKSRFQPYLRKAIPKKTALVGTARHECTLQPIHNDAYTAFERNRVAIENAPKFATKFMTDNVSGNLLAPGTTGANVNKGFTNFIKPSVEKRKATDPKAARIPVSDLLSYLFKCFEEHEYWSMKGFREKLNQPESYLKETLEQIAMMNKSGPFNGKWCLKPEYKNMEAERRAQAAALANAQAQASAGLGGGSAVGGDGAGGVTEPIEIDDDDDDDEVEMEDVPMS